MSVLFHAQNGDYLLLKGKKRKISVWVKSVIEKNGFKTGNINIICTGRNELLALNKSYLNHSYHTDVITFDYCEKNKISGDLFLGVEQITENAIKLKLAPENEILRVIIHGIFHLIGYADTTDSQKKQMRELEDNALLIFPQ
jgi:probable rRNA maturation factor